MGAGSPTEVGLATILNKLIREKRERKAEEGNLFGVATVGKGTKKESLGKEGLGMRFSLHGSQGYDKQSCQVWSCPL